MYFVGQALIERDPAVLDLEDEIAAHLADHAHQRSLYESEGMQVADGVVPARDPLYLCALARPCHSEYHGVQSFLCG